MSIIKELIPKSKDIPAVVKKHNLEVLLHDLKQTAKHYKGVPTKKTVERIDFIAKVILLELGYRFDFKDTYLVTSEFENSCCIDYLKRYISNSNYLAFGDIESDIIPVLSYVFNYIGLEIEYYKLKVGDNYIDISDLMTLKTN